MADDERNRRAEGVASRADAFAATAAQLCKRDVLTRPDNGLPAQDLLRSWQRSLAAIGDPGQLTHVPHVPEEILDEHLLDMVRAPMNTFADDLRGTGLALLLADSSGQILERWAEERRAMRHLDSMGTVRGAVLAEDRVGTNGVGTAVALAKPVQIRGAEHFAEFYQDAVCTSSPVMHPVTNNLIAVMTLSCNVAAGADLLRPLVRYMSRQLETHLLSVEKPASLEMFHLFLELSRKGGAPVVALGPEGSVLQSDNARRLSQEDVDLLRNLSVEGRSTGRYVVELSTGPTRLDFTSIGPANSVVAIGEPVTKRTAPGVTVPRARMGGRSREWQSVLAQIEQIRTESAPVIIAGETGVGKTTLALGFPFRLGATAAPDCVHEAASRHIQGLESWLSRVETSLSTHHALVIRGIDTLDAPALDALRTIFDAVETPTSVVLTFTARAPDEVSDCELKFGARSVWVRPLRERKEDIPEIWQALADALAPRAGLKLADQTLALMQRYDWPGNVKEMRRLLTRFVEIGRTGLIQPNELPITMQNAKSLTMIERAELEAIRRALVEAEGNRMKAADILGISRATVYRKMKAYKLSDS